MMIYVKEVNAIMRFEFENQPIDIYSLARLASEALDRNEELQISGGKGKFLKLFRIKQQSGGATLYVFKDIWSSDDTTYTCTSREPNNLLRLRYVIGTIAGDAVRVRQDI